MKRLSRAPLHGSHIHIKSMPQKARHDDDVSSATWFSSLIDKQKHVRSVDLCFKDVTS